MKTSKKKWRERKWRQKLIPWEAGRAGIWSNTSQYIYIYMPKQKTITSSTAFINHINQQPTEPFEANRYMIGRYSLQQFILKGDTIIQSIWFKRITIVLHFRSANWNISHKNLVFNSTTALLQSYNVSYYVLKTTIHSTTVNNTLP
jgi:hypothetical protein